MIRSDLSQRLIHLTRDIGGSTGFKNFESIIATKTLKGNNGHIRGGYKCICFTEAPISALGQILFNGHGEIRYSPYGFMFKKDYLFQHGARPVIYQPE